MDLSDSNEGEHKEVTELLDESEPSEITESLVGNRNFFFFVFFFYTSDHGYNAM